MNVLPFTCGEVTTTLVAKCIIHTHEKNTPYGDGGKETTRHKDKETTICKTGFDNF
jgi:hypothetical protein